MNDSDPKIFTITKVIIRNIKIDSSIENAIKLAVVKNKELEAKKLEVKIAKEQAKVYRILNKALSQKVLEQQHIQVMEKAIKIQPYLWIPEEHH